MKSGKCNNKMLTDAQTMFLDGLLQEESKKLDVNEVLKAAKFLLTDETKLLDSALDVLDTAKLNNKNIRCMRGVGSQNRSCWKVPSSR